MPCRIRHIVMPLLLWSISLFGQSVPSDAIKKYKENSKWQEYRIYVHLNKSVFIPGEQIYFSAYVFDRAGGRPVKEKMNLNIGLYDGQGKRLKGSVWEIQNGIAHGSLETYRNYKEGSYFFRAATRWNENFSGRGNFLMEIDLIENEIENNPIISNDIYVRFKPEGGVVLNDSFNSLGFQIIDRNGKGVALKEGHIEDADGQVINSGLSSNSSGLGRVNLFLKKDKTYHYRFELTNGQILRGDLPQGKEKGYSINLSGPLDKERIVTVRSGSVNFAEIKNNRFFLMVHQGNWLKSIPFKMDKKEKSFQLGKQYLAPGVNIVTLLDKDLNMLTNRLMFNFREIAKGDLQVFLERAEKDSIYLGFRSEQLIGASSRLSMSVLPDKIALNRKRKTMFDVFCLQPFLDSFAETSESYYNSFDRKTLFNMDLLLMIHGKTEFEWIRNKTSDSISKVPSEYGFSIRGHVWNKAKNKQNSIAFFQDQIDKMKILEINVDSTFSIDNYPVYEDLPVNFVLIDNKGNMKEPQVEFEIFPKKPMDSIEITRSPKIPDRMTSKNKALTNFMRAFEEQSNMLDNVTVVGKVADTETIRNPRLNAGFWNSVKINEDIRSKNQVLSRYLRRVGFRVRTMPPSNAIFVEARSNSPQEYPPTIFVDGFELNEPLTDYLLHTIDEIYYEHVGLTQSNGGSIYIYRKYDSRVADKSAPFLSLEVENGFKRPEPFISMIDRDSPNDRIKQYMSVHWEPKLKSHEGSEIILGFPKLGMKDFVLFVEGVTADGWIFSETYRIEDSQLILKP